MNHPQKQEDAEARNKNNSITDAIISSVTRPGDTEKEYFVMINGDTSRFSMFVVSNNRSNVVAGYGLGSDRNFPDYSGDSIAITSELPPMKRNAVNSYPEQIKELTLLFDAAEKDFDLEKLTSVRFGMSDIYGLSKQITEQYIVKYGERIHLKSNQHVCSLLRRSEFVAEVNRILTPGKLMIDKISIDGLAFDAKKSLDGMVIFGIKAIK